MSVSTFTPETLPGVLVCEMLASDIEHGARNKCKSCPVALMLKRLFPLNAGLDWWVEGGYADVFTYQTGAIVSYELDPAAVLFVARFDEGLPVERGTFRFRRAVA